jgi:tetratricopeptide (TPR) repeat protein
MEPPRSDGRSWAVCSKPERPTASRRAASHDPSGGSPIDADAYELFRRGSELLASRHAHQAVIPLERARDAAPEHGSVREALGRAYYGAGRPAAAEAEFAKALEIDPSNDYAHFGLALCLARGGERALAVGHLRLAVAMRPGVAAYQHALSRVQAQAAGPPEGPGESRGGAPVDLEGSGEPRGGAPVDLEGSGEPRGGAPVDREGSGGQEQEPPGRG